MYRINRLLVCLIISATMLAQDKKDDKLKERQNKLDIILHIQDTRSPHDSKLVSLLSDSDPVIREHAVRAYGNLQDTSQLYLLVQRLADGNEKVEFASTFAIGQTASQLSKGSRQSLEHDIIWGRLDNMHSASAERMIEEIGKFGTEQGLNDLLIRFGESYPQEHTTPIVMCIARFAIRGVITPEGVHYLLRFIHPIESTSWQVMYALQRIGDREELRYELDHIAQHYKHHDPLVRMYLASLLGKIKNERTSLEPLQKLADFDPDWRVRVNALKALSNFKLQGKDDIVSTFRRAFYSENMYIALTALSSFGNIGLSATGGFSERDGSSTVKEAFAALKRIAQNPDNQYLWQLQAEAVAGLAKLNGAEALPYLKLSTFPQPLLQARILEAMGQTGAKEAFEPLVQYSGESKSVLHRSALDGLRTLSEKNSNDTLIVNTSFRAALNGLISNDVAVTTTSASILGDSLFRRAAAVQPLLETLDNLRVPYDVEAIQEIVSTLGKLGDKRAVEMLTKQMSSPDRSVALASASALKSITGKDYSRSLKEWYQPLRTDFDFDYLHALPETVRTNMETSRGDIVMELYKGVAPFTVMSFLKLATQRGFYRGLTFHRVVPNFVIQGGDPRGDGWGGPEYSLRSEFSSLTYEAGTMGIASAGKDTEGSQFFITQSPQPHLDGRYTIFGKVISGMDVVNKIQVDDHIYDIKIIN